MIIETQRLIIRIPNLEDAEVINAGIIESIDELKYFLPWAQNKPSLEETRNNLVDALKQIESKKDIRLLIFHKNGEFIGSSGLHKIDWRIPKAEIGYWIRTSKTGNGYAKEAVDAITNHGINIMGIKRLEIIVSDSNKKSWQIPEKLGYLLEGILRKHRINPDGSIDNTRYYAKVV